MKFENAEVSVIRSKRKTISIQVKPNEVIIRAPIKMEEKDIEKFAESKRNRIEKHLQSLSEKQKLFEIIEPNSEVNQRGSVFLYTSLTLQAVQVSIQIKKIVFAHSFCCLSGTTAIPEIREKFLKILSVRHRIG